jgi:hypothetical protein
MSDWIDAAVEQMRWLTPTENPWPVPVLDLRPVTSTMLSVTTEKRLAENAVSFGSDDGRSFVADKPSVSRTLPIGLRFRADPALADGALFRPSKMEHKWAIFLRDDKLFFVRSWTRILNAVATVWRAGDILEITSVQGAFEGEHESPTMTPAVLDFLIRSHVMGLAHPAPLARDPSSDLRGAALWCFAMFGNLAAFATHLRWNPPMPEDALVTNAH